MVAVVVFEFSVMRCQPLRRALGLKEIYEKVSVNYLRDYSGDCRSVALFKSFDC